jgi:hypothetical protein
MSATKVMATNDAPVAKYAEVFVTLKGNRYAMLMCKNFEGKANISTQDVPRMGSIIMGKKPTSVELSFSMTIYKCTEIFDDVLDEFMKTGVMPTLDIQTSNDDPATSMGRSTKVYNNCVLDGDVLLSMAGSEDDFIEQEISGFAGGITRPEKYRNPAYM